MSSKQVDSLLHDRQESGEESVHSECIEKRAATKKSRKTTKTEVEEDHAH